MEALEETEVSDWNSNLDLSFLLVYRSPWRIEQSRRRVSCVLLVRRFGQRGAETQRVEGSA